MVCPANSTLTCFRLCGQVVPACCDGVAEDVTVTISLTPPTSSSYLSDPTTGAMIRAGQVYSEVFDAATYGGCWCTCELPATQAADANNALTAGGATYTITVTSGSQLIFSVSDFVLDYETAEAAGTDDFACGTCIPITNLLPPAATVPPTVTFCDAVSACITLPDFTLSGIAADGTVTLTGLNGGSTSSIVVLSQDAGNQAVQGSDSGIYVPAVADVVTSITGFDVQNPVSIVYVDELGVSTTLATVSTDANNTIAAGTDGRLHSPATSLVDNGDGSYTYTNELGTATTIQTEQVNGVNDVDENAGVLTFTFEDNTTVDVDVCQVIADNCNLAVNSSYVAYDPTTHVAGVAVGAGTVADPYQIPLPPVFEYAAANVADHVAGGGLAGSGTAADPWEVPIDPTLVVTTDGTATGVTHSGVHDHTVDILLLSADANNAATLGADGGLYVAAVGAGATYDLDATINQADGTASLQGSDASVDPLLIVSQDAGQLIGYGTDGGTLVTCTDVLDCVNLNYVTFDEAAMAAGTAVDGVGTVGDPLQIPIPPALVVTTDGTATGVTHSGVHDHTVDILLLSADADNDATLGTDGGIHVDVCAERGAITDVADCTANPYLLTQDCERIELDNVRPRHVLGSCTATPTTVAGADFTSTVAQSLSMVLADEAQVGENVVGWGGFFPAPNPPASSNRITYATDFPQTLNVNPTSAENDVVFVKVCFGNGAWPAQLDDAVITPGAGLGPGTLISRQRFWSSTITHELYAFDVTTAGPTTLDISHGPRPGALGNTADGFADGVWMAEVYLASGTTTLTPGDFGAPAETMVNFPTGSGRVNPDDPPVTEDSTPVDMGACDGLYFGTGRHVYTLAHDLTYPLIPSDWSEPSDLGVTEVNDKVSFNANRGACQVGTTAGVIPGGTGPLTFEMKGNWQTNSSPDVGGTGHATFTALSLTSCPTGGGGGDTATVLGCGLDVLNPACNPTAAQRLVVDGTISFHVEPGGHYQVTPRISGVAVTSKTVGVDNSGLGDVIDLTMSFHHSQVLAATVASGAAAPTQTLDWVVTQVAAGPAAILDEVVINDMTFDTELIHQ